MWQERRKKGRRATRLQALPCTGRMPKPDFAAVVKTGCCKSRFMNRVRGERFFATLALRYMYYHNQPITNLFHKEKVTANIQRFLNLESCDLHPKQSDFRRKRPSTAQAQKRAKGNQKRDEGVPRPWGANRKSNYPSQKRGQQKRRLPKTSKLVHKFPLTKITRKRPTKRRSETFAAPRLY